MINGVDDLLAEQGPDRVLELFDEAEAPQEKQLTQAQLLVELAESAVLFHTPDGQAYARIPVDDHWETWSLKSRGFRRWLTRGFYQKLKKPPGAQALQDALGVLEAKAQFDSPEAMVYTRIASYDGQIYIDLCNEKWEAVEITSAGWRLISDPPVRFRRSKGMLAMAKPVKGGAMTLLRKYINIGDDRNWVLCVSWLIAACRPDGPFPILILQGEQGSAKSSLERMLRSIIDPSTALVRTPPRDERDLLIAATNSWVVAYDNLSSIPPWLSDGFCRLSTGGGLSTRELYTDSDETFFDPMRPVMLNGIDQLAERADLADRAITLILPRIDDSARRDEKQLYNDFARELPQILGALFDAVSGALDRLPNTKLARLPRMADFALWAVAAESAAGFTEGTFIAAYSGNRADAVEATLDADPVATAILALMEKLEEERQPQSWTGTCNELLDRLQDLATEGTRKSPLWPKTPRAMAGRLRRLVTFLREASIDITFQTKAGKGRRPLTIARMELESTAATAATATMKVDDTLDKEVWAIAAGGDLGGGAGDTDVPGNEPPQKTQSAALVNKREELPTGGEIGGSGDSMQASSNPIEEEVTFI